MLYFTPARAKGLPQGRALEERGSCMWIVDDAVLDIACRSFQQSRIEAAGVENKASASIISSSSSELFLLLF